MQESFHDVLFADCGLSYVGDKSKVMLSDLQHDRICVLFSANWCPPCRKVVPLLANTVDKSNRLTSLDKLHVSVIYINFDQRSTGSFAANLSDDGPPIHEDEYIKNEKEAEFKIPDNWLILSSDGGSGSRAELLAHIVGVSRIPHMCIIEPGQLTNTSHVWSNVVPMLMADPDWLLCGSLSIQYLTAATLEMMVSIDRALVAIAWLKEDVSIAFDILQEVSKCVPNFKVHYYVGWDGDAATRYLRSLLDIGDQSPMLMYLDFENESFSICPNKQVDHHLFGSQQDILRFITAVESGSAVEISFPAKAKLN